MTFDPEDEKNKDIVKEAIKEWLDDQMKTLGWFSLKTVGVLALAGIVYLAFIGTGHFKT